MIKIIAFSIVALVLVVFLNNYNKEYSLIATVVSGAVLLVFLISKLYQPISELISVLESYSVEKEIVEYILKAVGISYLTSFATSLCDDFGQSSLSSKVQLAGRIFIFLISLPIMLKVLNIGLSLL